MDLSDLPRPDEALRLEPLPDGRHRVCVPAARRYGEPAEWITAYPPALVREIHATKGVHACDEIMREEDPRYVEHAIRREVLAYVGPEAFAGKRILDLGCGCGASMLVMQRLFPPCELVGVELQERLVRLARLRAAQLGRRGLRFLCAPSATALPDGLGEFDYVVLSAVYEHLLPAERRSLLPALWRHLRPGGVLFLNQTPNRWSPVEMHTTGLPLLNYLPDGLALRAARRFSRHVEADATWPALLREGIRGGTIREILALLGGAAELLEPRPEVGDRIDLWHGKLSRRHAALKRATWAVLKLLKPVGGLHLVPQLTLAIRKAA